MDLEELRSQIVVRCRRAIDKVKSCPYPEKQHIALATKYSGGAKVYYDNQIDVVLSEAPEKSFMGAMWINGGCPNLSEALYADQIPELYCNIIYKKKLLRGSDKDFLEFVEEDLEAFFISYYTYLRLKNASIKANTKAKYDISLLTVAQIYDICFPDALDCSPLTFCNAIYNPDTFCNIQGVKSNLMLFVNLMSKIKGLGPKWRKEVCLSMSWSESECSKRSIRNDIAADWCTMLKDLASPLKSRR